MNCIISPKISDQSKKRRKVRLNSDLVRLLGKKKVKDLLKFFEEEVSKGALKTGTDQ